MCYGKTIIPPEECRDQIIAEYHGSLIAGRKGVYKTYRRISKKYMWPGLRLQITEYIRQCRSCAERKITRTKNKEVIRKTNTPSDIFEKVSLDTIGKLPISADGNCHTLTMQDQLSKYCIFVAITDISANTIAHALATHLFSVYGAPKCILTDQGRTFTINLLLNLARISKVAQATTTFYHPRTNGSLEHSHAPSGYEDMSCSKDVLRKSMSVPKTSKRLLLSRNL